MARTVTITTRKTRAEILRAIHAIPTSAGKDVYFLRRIGLALLGQIALNYKKKAVGGTDQNHQRWAPLATYTLWLRKKHPGVAGDEILRVTDRLLESLTPAGPPEDGAVPLNPDQVFDIDEHGLTVGTSVEYAILQHEGRPPKLPRRRLWADPRRWTGTFWRPILKQAGLGLADLIAKETK